MIIKKYFSIKTLIQLCKYFQKLRITYGAIFFLQLNTIVNYIDEVCHRFIIVGLCKKTIKSYRNGSFRNIMMIRLEKLLKI